MLPNDLEIIRYEMILCICLYCDNRQNPAIKALDRNLSGFTTLFAPGKSWDNVRSTAAPYTESRLAHLVRNKCVGFPVVEQTVSFVNIKRAWSRNVLENQC